MFALIAPLHYGSERGRYRWRCHGALVSFHPVTQTCTDAKANQEPPVAHRTTFGKLGALFAACKQQIWL